MSKIVIIGGMGRSGTSLIASLLQKAGVDLGERVIPPGPANPRGFYEDRDFHEFHQKLLRARGQTALHTQDFSFEPTSQELEQARALIEQRQHKALWGWKDPHTSPLFLEFWHKLLPEANFLFLYRHPLEVLVSVLKARDYASLGLVERLEAWFVNARHIKEFCERHRASTLLCHVYSVVDHIDEFRMLLQHKFGLNLPLNASLVNSLYYPKELRRISLTSEVETVFKNIHLESAKLYAQFNSMADLPFKSPEEISYSPPLSTFITLVQALLNPPDPARTRASLLMLVALVKPELIEDIFNQYPKYLAELELGRAWLEEQYGNWQRVAEEREKIIQEQQAWIEELEKAKAWLEKQWRSWQKAAEERERVIQEQQEWQERSRAQQVQIAQLQEVAAQREKALQEWQERSHAQQAQITQLQEVVVQREKALQEWQERSHAQQAQITQLQAEFQRLWNSKSWRLTAPLRVIYGGLLHTRTWLKVQIILIAKKILPKPVKRSIKKAIGWEVGEEPAIPSPAATKVVEQSPWSKQRPLVSVIIPCYNYGRYVEEAIDSILQQTLQSFEIIVVNDGSTDPGTNELLKHLKKPKTRVIHQANQGLPEARNQGIRRARGKYICCLDADDTLEPTYLEKAVSLLEANPGIAFAYSWVRLFGDEQGTWCTEPFDLEKLLRYNHISVASLFRYDAWKTVGGYRSEMRQGYEDWEFWIRLGAHGLRGQLIPEALFNHRRHGRTMTHEAQEQHQRLVADIARRNQALFANPSLLKKIQSTYFDGHVNHPLLNLSDPKDFRQRDAKPSLLMLVPWLPVGGAETVLYQVLSGLRQSFELYLFTTLKSKNEWHDRFDQLTKNIYHLPNFLPEYAWEDFLANFMYTRNIQQVLISHSEFGYSILPKLKKSFPNVRTVDLLHNDSDLGFFRHGVQYDPYLDLHIVVNELIKQKLHAVGKVDLAKVCTIYNAIDEENLFNPALYQPEKVRERWQLPPGKKIVTYIGRLSREKQPDHFLRLAGKLKHRSDLFFLLVGDGHLRDVVEAEINQLGLQEQLRWYKVVSPGQIPEILSGTDLLVLTSEVEGFPMTVLEALAMGVPVISYDVGGVRSVVQSGVNGFIIPPQQYELLVQRVSEVLRDERMLKSLQKRARAVLIERGFTLERMIKQYQEVLSLNAGTTSQFG